jgi:hypothetical protein
MALAGPAVPVSSVEEIPAGPAKKSTARQRNQRLVIKREPPTERYLARAANRAARWERNGRGDMPAHIAEMRHLTAARAKAAA